MTFVFFSAAVVTIDAICCHEDSFLRYMSCACVDARTDEMLQCGIPTKKRKLAKYRRHNGGERPTKHDSAATKEESMLASL